MKIAVLGSRQFTFEDQGRFAELSGDSNPMHVDPVASRRTIYGDVVVHGVHSLLWALECLAETVGAKCALSRLKTEFHRQVRPGDPVSCKLVESDGKNFTLMLEIGGETAANIKVSFADGFPTAMTLSKNVKPSLCRDLTVDQMKTASGSLPLFLDEAALVKFFPKLLQTFPAFQIAEILATTRLVGMECPGLHSLYSGHDLRFHDSGGAAELSYQVTRSDDRFSMLWLTVKGPGLDGTITAFARPRPSAQPDMNAVSAIVDRGEFAGQRALIIGASRGLGEITAKIIAAGGGEIHLTHHRGKEDAERVAAEIRLTGAKCECLFYDAANPSENLANRLEAAWKPTHLYYFATPLISLEKTPRFSPEKFQNYTRFYVDGFARAVEAVLKLGGECLTVFYPSTIFLEAFQKHTTEYCAAKAAGELLCRHLEKSFPQVRVHCPRLPRMKTDQTSSLMPLETAEPMQVMLEAIRAMRLR